MSKSNQKKFRISDAFVCKLLNSIDHAQTLEDMLEVIPTAVPKLVASYHYFGAVGAFDYRDVCQFYTHNMPTSIVDYLDTHRKHESNPGVVLVMSKGSPVWLSEMVKDPYILGVGHDDLTRVTMAMTGDAICIPLYGPGSRTGYMFLAFGKSQEDCHKLATFRISSLAQRFHVRYCMLLEALHKQVNLTPREAEVLELVTFGKSNTDIATILGISSSTVGGHVQRLFLKLEVSDRVSAAMRARTLKIKI